MNESVVPIIFGMLMFFVGMLVGIGLEDNAKRKAAGYYECVSELPRNQDCKLIAVPDNQE